jgi:hypothetical protein
MMMTKYKLAFITLSKSDKLAFGLRNDNGGVFIIYLSLIVQLKYLQYNTHSFSVYFKSLALIPSSLTVQLVN